MLLAYATFDPFAFLPFIAVATLSLLMLVVAYWLLIGPHRKFPSLGNGGRQAMMLLLTLAGLFTCVLSLPLEPDYRELLIGVLGLIVTAAVTLSSTTFVSNAIAGLMLRAVQNFRLGDFVKINEHVGRVTERGMFHIEIQTEDRDLCTLPNMYLATHPVIVVRASGTVVSANVSLGYDVPRLKVEALLCEAASKIGLEKPFVHIMKLGDHSISYRFAGFLPEVKQLLTVRSQLRASALDTLHAAGIEIVSPTFMNQRRLPISENVLPDESVEVPAVSENQPAAEDIIFDKAEVAGELEGLRREMEKIDTRLAELKEDLAKAEKSDRARLERETEELEDRRASIEKTLNDAPIIED